MGRPAANGDMHDCYTERNRDRPLLFGYRCTVGSGGEPRLDRREPLRCGVAVVDLRRGRVVALLEFQTAVQEVFDVQLLPGLRFPEVIGFQQETIQHTFVVPRESPAP